MSLAIRIVTLNAEAELAGSTLVVRIPFSVSLHLTPSSSLSFEWHPVIGLPSQDSKQSLIVPGQGTASANIPCLGCHMT